MAQNSQQKLLDKVRESKFAIRNIIIFLGKEFVGHMTNVESEITMRFMEIKEVEKLNFVIDPTRSLLLRMFLTFLEQLKKNLYI